MLIKNTASKPTLALLIVTVFWGLTFPLIRSGVALISPELFIFVRFSIASLLLGLFLAFFWKKNHYSFSGIFIYFIASIPLYLSYWFQTIGLLDISSARAGFLTSLHILLVPLGVFLLFRVRLKKIEAVTLIGAFIGILIMGNPSDFRISKGDWWIIASAVAYALYIIALAQTKETQCSPVVATWVQITLISVYSLISYVLSGPEEQPLSNLFLPPVVNAILICALFATVLTFYLQTRYQSKITATKAATIYALEPLFAALFGFLLLSEIMESYEIIGGAILFSFILLMELYPKIKTG